jgi:hypothetical protein
MLSPILSPEELPSRPVERPSWRRVPAPLGFASSALVLSFAISSLALAGEAGTPLTPVRNPTASGPLRKNPPTGVTLPTAAARPFTSPDRIRGQTCLTVAN